MTAMILLSISILLSLAHSHYWFKKAMQANKEIKELKATLKIGASSLYGNMPSHMEQGLVALTKLNEHSKPYEVQDGH